MSITARDEALAQCRTCVFFEEKPLKFNQVSYEDPAIKCHAAVLDRYGLDWHSLWAMARDDSHATRKALACEKWKGKVWKAEVKDRKECDMQYAKDTNVSVSRTRAEIEELLEKHGSEAFASGSDTQALSGFIQFRMNGVYYRYTLNLPPRSDFERTPTGLQRFAETADSYWEKGIRAQWRRLLLLIKAKLVALEIEGITTFEQEFLAQTLMLDGQTMGQWAKPQISKMYSGGANPQPMLVSK